MRCPLLYFYSDFYILTDLQQTVSNIHEKQDPFLTVSQQF